MSNQSILLFENNEQLGSSYANILRRHSYHVTIFPNTEKAAEIARRYHSDLFIIDVEHPELLNMLLAQLQPEQSVLLIASSPVIAEAAICSGSGLHSFLQKPFKTKALLEAVATAIEKTNIIADRIRSKTLANFQESSNQLITAHGDNFYKLIVNFSVVNTKADYVALLLKDSEINKFVLKAEEGPGNSQWNDVLHNMTCTKSVVTFDKKDILTNPELNHFAETGVTALLRAPLIVRDELIGTLNHIKLGTGDSFNTSDIDYAGVLSQWASMLIQDLWLYNKIHKQETQVAKLLNELSFAQNNERKRVAVEIHDGVAQWLVSAAYDIRACNYLIAESRFDDLDLELGKIGNTLRRSIQDLRRTILDLRPGVLEEKGLLGALQQSVEMLLKEGITCKINYSDRLPVFTVAEESTIYWIVQEALNNIRKHAEASKVDISMNICNDVFSISVNDNGKGFKHVNATTLATSLTGLGLSGMKERAELLGGSLIVDSNQNRGTSISLTFPLISKMVG
ncbi:MAG: histidine kinase [Chloroflexi bacterium]|nr:histidine kinase [Chloroflexota bacterium]